MSTGSLYGATHLNLTSRYLRNRDLRGPRANLQQYLIRTQNTPGPQRPPASVLPVRSLHLSRLILIPTPPKVYLTSKKTQGCIPLLGMEKSALPPEGRMLRPGEDRSQGARGSQTSPRSGWRPPERPLFSCPVELKQRSPSVVFVSLEITR